MLSRITRPVNGLIPRLIPGLKLWLDANRIPGADDNSVTTWSDQSGNVHHATEATNPPIFKTNIVNGKPVVRFNGTTQFLTMTNHADFNLAAPWHLFVVRAPTGVGGTSVNLMYKSGAWSFQRDGEKMKFGETAIQNYITVKAQIESGGFKIEEYSMNDAFSVLFYLNGWLKETITGVSNPTVTANNVLIGKGGTFWAGDLAEVLFYSGTLSAANRWLIINYLKNKYGIYVSANDVDLATAINDVVPLTSPTHDGHGETVQPDVVYVDAGWNGYKYWMAFTSWPTDDRIESTDLIASNDGDSWEVPDGLTNPIPSEPPANYDYADPCLFFSPDGLTLHLVYMVYHIPGTNPDQLALISSTDGVNWSAPIIILTSSGVEPLTSPSVIWDGSQYVLYTCDATTDPRSLKRWTAPSLTGSWSSPINCTFVRDYGDYGYPTIAASHPDFPYHGHVKYSGGVYYGIYTDRDDAFLISSHDGVTWQFIRYNGYFPVTLANGVGTWDAEIYSCSLLKLSSGFDLFYSGDDKADPAVFHIGRTTITGIT